jgi:hypothetical protein
MPCDDPSGSKAIWAYNIDIENNFELCNPNFEFSANIYPNQQNLMIPVNKRLYPFAIQTNELRLRQFYSQQNTFQHFNAHLTTSKGIFHPFHHGLVPTASHDKHKKIGHKQLLESTLQNISPNDRNNLFFRKQKTIISPPIKINRHLFQENNDLYFGSFSPEFPSKIIKQEPAHYDWLLLLGLYFRLASINS